MSSTKSSPKSSRASSPLRTCNNTKDEDYYVTPEFIYGGPFIKVKVPSPFIDAVTPMNLPLQGTFKQSFAYLSLKDKLPVILTKIIDKLSKKGDGEAKSVVEKVAKLRSDLMTNKEYEHFTVGTPEAEKWNLWIDNQLNKKYFTNNFVFTECYVYRRVYEACEMTKDLKDFDYFSEDKNLSFTENLLALCIAAERIVGMMNTSDKDKRKQDFITILKLSLWANKLDLSFSVGEQRTLAHQPPAPEPPATPEPPPPPPKKGKGKGKNAGPPKPIIISLDPFQMIIDLKDRVVVDHSGKIADQLVAKAEKTRAQIEAFQKTTFKQKCSCHRLATSFGMKKCLDPSAPEPEPTPPPAKGKGAPPPPPPAAPAGEGAEGAEGEAPPEEPPKIPCPAKMTVPNHVFIDIICDNSGYELFTDLCLGTFLIKQKIVDMVRFHLKKMPWFVSDATRNDFRFVIDSCKKASFSKDIPAPTPPAEGESDTKSVNSSALNELGTMFEELLAEGAFVIMDEDFWTYPHSYNEMKKYDYNMYRKLQFAVGIVFKGDLNYRKLLAERNVNPYTTLEVNLQGFIPAPIVAIRTVKSEIVCGLGKGKADVYAKIDPNWKRTGEFGLIQYCAKAEPRKVADRPCLDYCEECLGIICPDHQHDM